MRKAREIWFLCRQYTASEALEMGLVHKVVTSDVLKKEAEAWCKEICDMSPTAIKFTKLAFKFEFPAATRLELVDKSCSAG